MGFIPSIWREVLVTSDISLREVHDILPYDKSIKYPRCIDGARMCPSENSAGLGSYDEILSFIKKPEHKAYNQTLFELGGEIDLDYFCCEEVNFLKEDIDSEEEDSPF